MDSATVSVLLLGSAMRSGMPLRCFGRMRFSLRVKNKHPKPNRAGRKDPPLQRVLERYQRGYRDEQNALIVLVHYYRDAQLVVDGY